LDRKIEFPLPDLEGRANILRIHSNKMNVNFQSVNFEELARSTEDFNGAMLKAVCVEAGKKKYISIYRFKIEQIFEYKKMKETSKTTSIYYKILNI